MTANELRTMYVNFFKERGHKMSRFSDTKEKITGGDPPGKRVLAARTQKSSMTWANLNVVLSVDPHVIVGSMLRFRIMSLCSLTKRQMVALQSLHRKMWIQEWAWNVY